MRKPLIAGNWKMNLNIEDSVKLVNSLKELVSDVKDREILVCPSFTCLKDVNSIVSGTNIKLGSQNICYEDKGAFTGEISASMLKEVGCSYAIVGHSERRHVFHENNDMINLRVKNGIKNGLKIILCVGETLEQREADETTEIIIEQVQIGLKDVSAEDMFNVVIAYEPVWAIGTGKTASSEQAQEIHAMIRNLIKDIFNENISSSVRILYGGSVKPSNIKELMEQEDIDGALVGGAALEAQGFSEIVKY
jgi:triosephosphate isomerase (TIM)